MKSFRLLVPVICLAAAFALAAAPKEKPAPPDAAVLKTLGEQVDKLEKKIGVLRRLGVTDPYLAEVEIYHKAAVYVLEHEEFNQKAIADWTREILDRGLLRAAQQTRGEAPWMYQAGQSVSRAYRSRIDGSVQPYAVAFPADYGKDRLRKWRVDVVLHGRNDALTEVAFLHQHNGLTDVPVNQDWVQIDVYGRGNNAYRWAGESDVQEAVENFIAVEQLLGRGALVDRSRFMLRGFSMGGAGTWHIGLHRPSAWSVIGPGAGFTSSHGYKNIADKLPPYQEACLSIYDAVDYAENAFDVPVVAYAGSKDPQLQAARNIEDKLKGLHIPMTLLIAPGLAHQFPAEWQKKAEEEYEKYLANGRPTQRPHIHFVTYTLKYPSCDWLEILGLDHHYQRALVDAQRSDNSLTVKTENVQCVHFGMPPGAVRDLTPVTIDGQSLKIMPYQAANGELHLYLERRGGQWAEALPERLLTERLRTPRKTTNLQGPIDDAFTGSFLCVRGTGGPWNDGVQQYADADLKRFEEEWSKYFRGDLQIKDDRDVTPEDLVSHNVILFGDPGSNSILAQAMPGLPFQWTKDKIAWNGKEYPAAEHVPVLIYPSPFAVNRYVVVNSGHTFHAEDFKGTNALLYPRLGDYAVLKRSADKKEPLLHVEVVDAGLFDDLWHWPAK